MSQPDTEAVRDEMAKIFEADYGDLFRPAYERTCQMLQALPVEPGEEIRNAFDHFALASGQIATIVADPSQAPTIREQAFVNTEQARRHIVAGRFYCVEHQLLHLMQEIRRFAGGVDEEHRPAIQPFQQEADTLALRLPPTRLIELGPTRFRQEALDQITALNIKLRELFALLRDYMNLYDRLRDAIASLPQQRH